MVVVFKFTANSFIEVTIERDFAVRLRPCGVPVIIQRDVAVDSASSNAGAVDRTALKTLSVKTIVVANTSAPQATCATVIPTIGFNGWGSLGDFKRVRYAATPSISCKTSRARAIVAGRVKNFSPGNLRKTVNEAIERIMTTAIAPPM
jgi:hypothetical protein